MTAPAKPRRKGGRPIYSPETAARRTAGKVERKRGEPTRIRIEVVP